MVGYRVEKTRTVGVRGLEKLVDMTGRHYFYQQNQKDRDRGHYRVDEVGQERCRGREDGGRIGVGRDRKGAVQTRQSGEPIVVDADVTDRRYGKRERGRVMGIG